jgi:hypothetical protein
MGYGVSFCPRCAAFTGSQRFCPKCGAQAPQGSESQPSRSQVDRAARPKSSVVGRIYRDHPIGMALLSVLLVAVVVGEVSNAASDQSGSASSAVTPTPTLAPTDPDQRACTLMILNASDISQSLRSFLNRTSSVADIAEPLRTSAQKLDYNRQLATAGGAADLAAGAMAVATARVRTDLLTGDLGNLTADASAVARAEHDLTVAC